MWEQTNGIDFYGVNRKNIKNKFQFGNDVLWFPKGENTHLGKFKEIWFGHSGYSIVYSIILFFLFLLTILYQIQYWLMLTS